MVSRSARGSADTVVAASSPGALRPGTWAFFTASLATWPDLARSAWVAAYLSGGVWEPVKPSRPAAAPC